MKTAKYPCGLDSTAGKMNERLEAAGREEQWTRDTDTASNSCGYWYCGNLGGVGDAATMRGHTSRLIA